MNILPSLDYYFDTNINNEALQWALLHYKFGLNLKKLALFRNILEKLEINTIDDLINSNITEFSSKLKENEIIIIQEIHSLINDKTGLDQIKKYLSTEKIIPIISSEYPSNLKEIANPPLVIIVKGKIPLLDKAVAVVGKRNATSLAQYTAVRIGEQLALNGYVVVSGLAYGIDTQSFIGALGVGGKSIAVLGTPVNEVYPKENQSIYDDVLVSGAVISDVFSRNALAKRAFYERNRIISGLSKAVIVVEANKDGGTIRQMVYAKEQGKKIFMFIPPVGHKMHEIAVDVAEKFNAIKFRSIESLMEKLQKEI